MPGHISTLAAPGIGCLERLEVLLSAYSQDSGLGCCWGVAMAGFVQVIEIRTTRVEEIDELLAGWLAQTEGIRKAQRGTFTRDRDRPDVYVQIVEFPSYEEAMANSSLPATAEFARKLAELCDAAPTFRNLDVLRVEDM